MIPHKFGAKKPPNINNEEVPGAEKAYFQFYLRMGFEDIGFSYGRSVVERTVKAFQRPSPCCFLDRSSRQERLEKLIEVGHFAVHLFDFAVHIVVQSATVRMSSPCSVR